MNESIMNVSGMNGSQSNGSVKDDDYLSLSSPISFYVSTVVGVLAITTNLFILTVFTSIRFKNAAPLVIALTTVHAMNGGIHTYVWLWSASNDSTTPVTSVGCLAHVWPLLFVAIYQLLPIILALNGIERLLAVKAPIWYHKHCTPRCTWFLAASTCPLGLLLITGNAVIGWLNDGPPISPTCVNIQMFGTIYIVFGMRGVALVGGALATTCVSMALDCARRKMAAMPTNSQAEMGRLKKQMKLAQCLLTICVIDMICVVGPNIVLILSNAGLIYFPMRYVTYPVVIYCSDSVWNVIAFLLFNSEFRKAVSRLRCKKANSDVKIFTSGASQQRSNWLRRRGGNGGNP